MSQASSSVVSELLQAMQKMKTYQAALEKKMLSAGIEIPADLEMPAPAISPAREDKASEPPIEKAVPVNPPTLAVPAGPKTPEEPVVTKKAKKQQPKPEKLEVAPASPIPTSATPAPSKTFTEQFDKDLAVLLEEFRTDSEDEQEAVVSDKASVADGEEALDGQELDDGCDAEECPPAAEGHNSRDGEEDKEDERSQDGEEDQEDEQSQDGEEDEEAQKGGDAEGGDAGAVPSKCSKGGCEDSQRPLPTPARSYETHPLMKLASSSSLAAPSSLPSTKAHVFEKVPDPRETVVNSSTHKREYMRLVPCQHV